MPVPLINDRTWREHMDPTAHDGRDRVLGMVARSTGFGECAVARPLDESTLIPRSQWAALIRQKDAEESWAEDIIRGKVPCKDQSWTSYCHGYAPTQIVECQRYVQGHPYVELSGQSIGGPVTGWRNRGAYPEEDLRQFVEFGACPESMMDQPYSFNPDRWDPAWTSERHKYQIDEWVDGLVRHRAFDALVSFAFQSILSFVAYGWWSHALGAGFRVLDLGRGRFAVRHRNNWGSDYGDDGFVDLEEGRGTPDICLFGVGLVTASG